MEYCISNGWLKYVPYIVVHIIYVPHVPHMWYTCGTKVGPILENFNLAYWWPLTVYGSLWRSQAASGGPLTTSNIQNPGTIFPMVDWNMHHILWYISYMYHIYQTCGTLVVQKWDPSWNIFNPAYWSSYERVQSHISYKSLNSKGNFYYMSQWHKVYDYHIYGYN